MITLLLTGVTIIACIIFCKGVEKRSMYSMGFVKKKALPSYIIGLLTGFLMLFACYLICAVTGALEFKGINSALDEKDIFEEDEFPTFSTDDDFYNYIILIFSKSINRSLNRLRFNDSFVNAIPMQYLLNP